jgi:CubicO group peptidase (beta-lactamase class C family)
MEHKRPESAGFSPQRLARIRPAMQRYIDEGLFAGILTMIARKGEIVHCESVGMRNLEAGKPIQENTIFRIYSMSKLITSVAALILYEEGLFCLHDPVDAFLPEFKDIQVAEKDTNGQWQLVPPARPITIRSLLTHTSGLSYGADPDHLADKTLNETIAPLWSGRGEYALRDFVRGVAASPLHHQPGEIFHYSVSTDVLGRLVEVVSGMPFGEFLRKRIFEPLHMQDTSFYVPVEKVERFACMYGPLKENDVVAPGKLKNIDPIPESAFLYPDRMQGGGGGLVSTAPDYLRFCQMLLNHGELDGELILGRKTVDLMRMNHLPEGRYMDEDLKAQGFGLGGYVLLHPERHTANGSVGNFGWGGAANTFFWIDFVEEMIPIIMIQYQPFMPFPIEDMYKNLVYQALV